MANGFQTPIVMTPAARRKKTAVELGNERLNRLTAGFQIPGSPAVTAPPTTAAPRGGLPDFTPAPKQPIFGPAPAIEGIASPTRAEFRADPVGKALESSFFTSEAVKQRLLPQFLDTGKPRALPQIGAFIPETAQDLPERVSLAETARRLAPGATESMFRPLDERSKAAFVGTDPTTTPGFTGGPSAGGFQPEFVGTKAITPEILDSPQFQAFKAQLEQETGEQSSRIADEFARRGILSSGATKDAFEKLGASGQRVIASVLGNIAQPLITESTLQESIREPIRATEFGERGEAFRFGAGEREAGRQTSFDVGEARADEARRLTEAARATGFGEREAERETGFGLTQQEREQRAETEAINRALGIAGGEAAGEQSFENLTAGLSREERARQQDFADRAAALPFEQEQAGLDFQRQIQNLISGLLTGGQVSTGSFVQQQRTEEQARQAQLNREQQQRSSNQAFLSNALSNLLELS